MATAMGLGSLFRSETAGALGTMALLGLEVSVVGAVARAIGLSPFWNPLTATGADAEQLLAMAVRNRIGTALAIAAIVALTFARAERRERMLSG